MHCEDFGLTKSTRIDKTSLYSVFCLLVCDENVMPLKCGAIRRMSERKPRSENVVTVKMWSLW